MDSLRRALASIRKYLGELSATHLMVIVLVVVVIGLMGYVVSQVTSKPEWVVLLPGATQSEQQAAALVLTEQNIKHRAITVLEVPPDLEWMARGAVAEAGRLPQDITTLFKNTIDKQTWYTSRHQSDQFYNMDLNNALARLISNFSGVKTAQVVLDSPQAMGLGSAVRRPTAAVTVWMRPSKVLTQNTVDAIAGLLAGAKSGLDVSNIKVIDASTGRQRRPTRDDEMVATTYLEHAKKVEDQMQEKLGDLLAYIHGATVAVTAQVDVTSMTARVTKALPMGEGTVSLIKKETGNKTTQGEASRGAEPGPRSNQAADISRSSSGKGSKMDQETNESEFESKIGTEEKNIIDPRGMPTSMVASINVPKGYIVNLLKPPAKEGETKDPSKPDVEPTVQEVDARFKIEQASIMAAVKPHLRAHSAEGTVEGEVIVSLVPGEYVATSVGPAGGGMSGLGMLSTGGGSIGGFALGSGLIDKAVVSVLAIAALTMMVMMVKKAGKKIDMPTAEELVGVPADMALKTDVIGEATEGETPLEGIEVDEEAVQSQKMLESVGEFVSGSPEGAAKLMRRWMSADT